MKSIHRVVAVWGLTALAACGDSPVAAPSTSHPTLEKASRGGDDRERGLTAMTQNMYVGADLDAVISALATPDPTDDFPALLAGIQTLGQTDYPTRARAFAQTIARERPMFVGLQEVSAVDIDLTALGLPSVIHLDFLATLASELAARGLHYRVAAQVQNITAEPVPGIRLVDYDALLVDADRVTVIRAAGHTFSNNLGPVAPGVDLKRGWVSAEVTIGSRAYTVASTHLESGSAAGLAQLRAAQAAELLASLPTERPTLVMGDLNDTPGSLMYQALIRGGFADAWRTLRPGVPGFTCCEVADLSNPLPRLDQRIDYLFVRLSGGQRLAGKIERVGIEPSSRIAGPVGLIWPSDHAGLAGELWVAAERDR